MYGILTGFLIALVNNVDNISVRVAYSLKGVRIGLFENLWISVVTFIISTLAALLGGGLGSLAGEFCRFLSMAVLAGMGTFMIAEPYIKRKKTAPRKAPPDNATVIDALRDPEASDLDHSKTIDFREATLLGVSLSINNVGGCMSAGMIGLNAFFIGTLSAAVSFTVLLLGNLLAGLFQRLRLGRKASVAAGLILIAIGVRQILP